MILVDTTVWIDLFNGRDTSGVLTLKGSIDNNTEDICICGIIYTEILQGIRDDREFNETQAVLDKLTFLPIGKETFSLAAQIYRRCRKHGSTIRAPADCTIAACCIEQGVFLLHNDRDFRQIAKHSPLQFSV